MMDIEDLQPTRKYMEQGDGAKGDWKKLAAALFLSAVIIASMALIGIRIFISTGIRAKSYDEIIAEISITDGRRWLADSDNRKTLEDCFNIRANGEAKTESNGKDGIRLTVYSSSYPRYLSFSYSDGFLTAYHAKKTILLSFSDDMQAFAIKINDEMIIFESSY